MFKLSGPHNNGPLFDESTSNTQYKIISFDKFILKIKKEADSYFYSNENEVVNLINIAYSQEVSNVVLIRRKFKYSEDFYDYPIKSSHFNILLVSQLSNSLNIWSISNVKNKFFFLMKTN